MSRIFRAGAVTGLCSLLFVMGGCSLPGITGDDQVKDASGTSKAEAEGMTLKAEYRLAGERYAELNERVAELQRDLFKDEWLDSSVTSEVIPRQGFVLGGALKGDDRENSYYFTATRWHETAAALKPMLRSVAEVRESRGLNVTEETAANGTIRIIATAEAGFWFAADEMEGQLELSAFSPVYWGDQFALLEATADRRDAENEAGVPWDTTDRDENGHAYRLPGVYRPFPAWEAVPE